MTALGATSLPVLVIQHPLGGEGLDGVSQRIAQAIEQLSGLLAAGGQRTPDQRAAPSQDSRATAPMSQPRATVQLEEDDVYPEFVRREWCDGLPFVAPTRARVDAMLAGARADGAESLGLMPPLWRECTLEALAVNAVMAGAEPSYFPGHRRGRAGHAGPGIQSVRRAGDHPSGGAAGDRHRPVRPGHRAPRGIRALRTRLPRQCHDRARHPPDAPERGRGLAGPA